MAASKQHRSSTHCQVDYSRYTKGYSTSPHTRAYATWQNIRAKCRRPNHPDYYLYGGRGITVCERWESFENFFEDMGHPPPNKSIDRINNDGHYCPSNCEWRTQREQSRNQRTNVLITLDGRTQCLQDWADEVSQLRNTFHRRYIAGLSLEEIKALGPTKSRSPA